MPLKTGSFDRAPESALGAGGREFESRRPDQKNQADAGISRMPENPTVDKTVAVAFLGVQQEDQSRGKFADCRTGGTQD